MSTKESKLITLTLCCVGFSAILTFAIIEVALRFYFSIHNDFDIEMWKYSIKLKTPTEDSRLHKHVAGTQARLMGVDVQINSHELRGSDHEYKKPADTFRILALGDSFTFGWGVAEDSIFLSLLEKKLKQSDLFPESHNLEIINMGIGNYNTRQELAAFELEGRKYSPDVVLLCFYVNDAEAPQLMRMNWFESSSYAYAFLMARLRRLRFYFGSSLNYREYYVSTLVGEAWKDYSAVLEQTVNSIRTSGAEPIVILLPDLRNMEANEFSAIYSKIQSFLVDRDTLVLNLEGKLKERPSNVYWVAPDDPHPNALAHREMSDLMFEFLAKNRFGRNHAH